MLVRLAPSVLVVSLLACSAPSSTEAPPEATSGAARAEDDTGGGETPRARNDDAEPAPSSADREAPREPTEEAADPEPSPRAGPGADPEPSPGAEPRAASESSPDAEPSEGGTSGESGPEAEAAPLVAGPPTPLTLACGRAPSAQRPVPIDAHEYTSNAAAVVGWLHGHARTHRHRRAGR